MKSKSASFRIKEEVNEAPINHSWVQNTSFISFNTSNKYISLILNLINENLMANDDTE